MGRLFGLLAIVIAATALSSPPAEAQSARSKSAPAKAARIDKVVIRAVGIIKLGGTKTIKDSKISTGTRTESDEMTVIEKTTRVTAGKIVFGVEFDLIGEPKGGGVPLKVVWRYPDPGLLNPATGKAKFLDQYDTSLDVGGKPSYLYWSMGEEWTQVPGRWVVELWDGERRLLSQDFDVVK